MTLPRVEKMAFRFKQSEKVSKGVRRLVLKQTDKAIEQFRRPPASAEDAVHDARVCFKKIRAILQLARGGLAPGFFKEHDKRFRNLGRQLSQLRDRDVSVETFDKLVKQFQHQLEPRAFANIRAVLVRWKRPRREQKMAMTALEKEVRSLRRDIMNLSLKREKFAALRPGLKQLYRDGQQLLATATESRRVEDLHEWRKRVKSLLYAQTVLRPVWDGMVQESTKEFDQLGNYLSDDHDLAMLRETVKNLGEDQEDVTEFEALIGLLDLRRTELETKAEFLGRRLYAEKPSAFVGRFETYWNCWRSERRVGAPALADSPDSTPNSQ